MVLTEVQAGNSYIVHAIDGEGETRSHLEQLGLVPGTRIDIVSRMGGSLIIGVRGSRVAVDKQLAKCVLV